MEYRWDSEELKDKIVYYEDIYENSKSKKTKKSLEKIINFYCNLYTIANNESYVGTCLTRPSYVDFHGEDSKFLFKENLPYTIIANEYYSLTKDIQMSSITLPKNKFLLDDALGIIRDFFSTLDIELFEILLKSYETLPTHLKILNKNTNGYVGGTWMLDGIKDVYYEILKKNTISFLFSITHELGHGIGHIYRNGFSVVPECVEEVFPLFLELLLTDFIAKKPNLGLEKEIIRKQLLNNAINYSKKIVISENQLKDFADDYNFKNIPPITKCSLRKQVDPTDDLFYLSSYTIALELYYIYRKDPKSAITMLKKILNIKELDNTSSLESIKNMGICPISSLEKEILTLNLKKQVN